MNSCVHIPLTLQSSEAFSKPVYLPAILNYAESFQLIHHDSYLPFNRDWLCVLHDLTLSTFDEPITFVGAAGNIFYRH